MKFWWADVALGAVLALVAFAVLVLVNGCAAPQVGPFLPAPPRACAADPDCPPKESCRFPSAGSHALCMATGWNDADDFVTDGE